jgi:cobalt/nickel transport system ATP-binding protein
MSTAPLVRIRGLKFRYDDGTDALRGIDFDLLPGETVALLGPNGSGKTTFLLHLNGLLRGDGEVMVCGLPVNSKTTAVLRRKVGFLFQDPDEQMFLPTVMEDVLFGPIQQGKSPHEARHLAEDALQHVGLVTGWEKPPYHLSAGEKRRAALAGVLAMQPELLVMDEPTTHLDPPARRQLIALFQSLPQAKIVVTHDIPFAKALATRAAYFDAGLILGQGPVDEVIRRFDWEDPR